MFYISTRLSIFFFFFLLFLSLATCCLAQGSPQEHAVSRRAHKASCPFALLQPRLEPSLQPLSFHHGLPSPMFSSLGFRPPAVPRRPSALKSSLAPLARQAAGGTNGYLGSSFFLFFFLLLLFLKLFPPFSLPPAGSFPHALPVLIPFTASWFSPGRRQALFIRLLGGLSTW